MSRKRFNIECMSGRGIEIHYLDDVIGHLNWLYNGFEMSGRVDPPHMLQSHPDHTTWLAFRAAFPVRSIEWLAGYFISSQGHQKPDEEAHLDELLYRRTNVAWAWIDQLFQHRK